MKTLARLYRHKRTRRKVSGTSSLPRVSVFRSKKHIYAQVIDDVAGETLVSCSTLAKEFKEKKIKPSTKEGAEVLGQILAEKAKEKGIVKVCFDKSGYKYHGRVKALAEGLRKGGLKF